MVWNTNSFSNRIQGMKEYDMINVQCFQFLMRTCVAGEQHRGRAGSR